MRLAKGINRLLGRRGRVFIDRYFQRVLRSPREVHHCLRNGGPRRRGSPAPQGHGRPGRWARLPRRSHLPGDDGRVHHSTGGGWSTLTTDPPQSLYGVSAAGTAPLILVGEAGTILRLDKDLGVTPIPSPTNAPLTAVQDLGADGFCAVGFMGVILGQCAGQEKPTLMPWDNGGNENLRGVWGRNPGNLFVAGGRGGSGLILQLFQSTWLAMKIESISSPVPELLDIWGTSGTDIYAVGRSGTILHFDGAGWSRQPSLSGEDLWGVSGSGTSDVFAVGTGGTILHTDGKGTWQPLASGVASFLVGLAASPTRVTVVGYNGPAFDQPTEGVILTLDRSP